jgi:opacity protein-like surface antigen
MSVRTLPAVASLAMLACAAVYAVPQLTGAGVSFSRTVTDASGISGQLTFDKGCTKKDQYGSNDCTLAWGAAYTVGYNVKLTKDIVKGDQVMINMLVDRILPLKATWCEASDCPAACASLCL